MARKKKGSQQTAAVAETAVVEATPVNNLRTSLQEIKTYDGVIGYILRNSTSVAVDLKDPTKIIDYAIISSVAHDVSEELSELFNLGDIKNTVIKGKDIKMLSLMINENKISVFMEKNADSEKALRKLHAL